MRRISRVAALCLFTVTALGAEDDLSQRLREFRQENEVLQKQLQKQQEQIEQLSRKVATLQEQREADPPAGEPAILKKVHLSGEGGAAFFHTGSQGQFPNSEFRIDEAKLFVEASIWDEVYFFSEINFFTREETDEGIF